MPFPRMTTRRWTIAVAVVAVGLTGIELKRRRALYSSVAVHYADLVANAQEADDKVPGARIVQTATGQELLHY